MARTSRDSRLENRTQRLKLKTQHPPYWGLIGQGLYLGYRKGKKGGAWIVRYYLNRKYVSQKIGKADDYQDANGIDVLSYFQAQAKAREYTDKLIKKQFDVSSVSNLKVKDIAVHYLDWFKLHRKSFRRTQHVVLQQILPKLGHYCVDQLTTKNVRKWHETLAKTPPRLKSVAGKARYAEFDESLESIRKRKATANRILTVLKAALNYAWREGLIESNAAWQRVKPFREVNAPKVRFLNVGECQRLINACDLCFRNLVRAALLTGCRYGELTRLKVNDFNIEQGTLYIAITKSGHPRCIPLTDEGREFFEEVTAGKLGDSYIFVREDGSIWGESHQIRRLKKVCEAAKIEPAVSFHILRHTYGSLLASKGVPLQVIAELLGHSDTRITSRHYAHLMPSFVADTLRANLPRFIKNNQSKVLRIDKVSGEKN